MVIAQRQTLNGFRTKIQDDAPILHESPGHHRPLYLGIDQQVGSKVVVDDPVIDRPDQVGFE